MKRHIIFSFALSMLAANAFAMGTTQSPNAAPIASAAQVQQIMMAEDGFDRTPQGAIAEDGYDHTPQGAVAEDGYDHTPQGAVAEDGYDHTPQGAVAEDGYDHTQAALQQNS